MLLLLISFFIFGIGFIYFHNRDIRLKAFDSDEDKDFAFLWCFIWFFILGLFSCGTISQILDGTTEFTKQLVFMLLGLSLILLVFLILFKIVLEKKMNMAYYKRLLYYMNKLSEIQEQIKNVNAMYKKLDKSSSIPSNKVNEDKEVLMQTRQALQNSYSDILMAYNAARLNGTFSSITDLVITDDAKKELQKQIDVLQNLQEL